MNSIVKKYLETLDAESLGIGSEDHLAPEPTIEEAMSIMEIFCDEEMGMQLGGPDKMRLAVLLCQLWDGFCTEQAHECADYMAEKLDPIGYRGLSMSMFI